MTLYDTMMSYDVAVERGSAKCFRKPVLQRDSAKWFRKANLQSGSAKWFSWFCKVVLQSGSAKPRQGRSKATARLAFGSRGILLFGAFECSWQEKNQNASLPQFRSPGSRAQSVGILLKFCPLVIRCFVCFHSHASRKE